MSRLLVLSSLISVACVDLRTAAEDPDPWYSSPEQTWVEEPVAFTDVPYSFPGAGETGIRSFRDAVFPVENFYEIAYGPDEQFPDGACRSVVDNDLPYEVRGIVTLKPAWYQKIDGCLAQVGEGNDLEGTGLDSDEKYYSSYFIQDKDTGVFVLFDSRVAPFDMGDYVTLRVRGVRTSFDVDMIYAHDIVSVEHASDPIYYEELLALPTLDDVGKVKRISGTVTAELGTFGDISVETDEGLAATFSLSLDLNRRRAVDPKVGDHVVVTGPVLYSYEEYPILVTHKGQVEITPAN
jgi:hypothetical protein